MYTLVDMITYATYRIVTIISQFALIGLTLSTYLCKHYCILDERLVKIESTIICLYVVFSFALIGF